MKQDCWKGKRFKLCSFSQKYRKAGRNSSGRITMFHRGGGSKRLLRRIDFKRNILSTGVVERIEYDPNRSARIALVKWQLFERSLAFADPMDPKEKTVVNVLDHSIRRLTGSLVSSSICAPYGSLVLTDAGTNVPGLALPRDLGDVGGDKGAKVALPIKEVACPAKEKGRGDINSSASPLSILGAVACLSDQGLPNPLGLSPNRLLSPGQKTSRLRSYGYFSYILACDKLELQATIINGFCEKPISNTQHTSKMEGSEAADFGLQPSTTSSAIDKMYQQVGNCIPLGFIPIGTFVHNIEERPGQGGQLVRAAGTFAQLVQKLENTQQSVVRLPSGILKPLDSLCRATIGIVSNSSHNTIKLQKAGQNRWLGKRPIVRGVAMNPIDHPHGGGEGRSKGGRPSVSPWGKPTKGGFKTVIRKRAISFK